MECASFAAREDARSQWAGLLVLALLLTASFLVFLGAAVNTGDEALAGFAVILFFPAAYLCWAVVAVGRPLWPLRRAGGGA